METKNKDLNELKKLEREGTRIRKEINLYMVDCALPLRDIEHLHIRINELISNELLQEKLCNK